MKLCINCQHLQRSQFNERMWKCGARPTRSPVTGLSETKYAVMERRDYGECGPEARLFSPMSEDNNGVPG